MARGRSLSSSTIRWGAVAVLVAVGIGAGALVAAAYDHATPGETTDAAAPVPTFTLGVETPTPTPTPEPVAAPPRDAERFLAVGTGAGSDVWWRATAGACGGPAPSLERSADAGATWVDVTPLYKGVAQLVALDSFAQTQAQIVAAVGSSCEPQALGTFTQGQFWDSYPDVLAASRFISVTDAATVQMPSGRAAAPCADARGLRAEGDIVALICDSTAFVSTGSEWVAFPAPDAAAVAIAGDSVLIAHAAPDCPGLSLRRYASADPSQPEPASCAEGIDPAQPLAVASTPAGTLIWSGDTISLFP